MDAIVVKNLTKIFVTKERKGFLKKSVKKRIVAVDHISFNVRRGEVFGLLGPNGAGKTTTIKMLSTLLIPDEGDAWVNGYHVVREANKVRESIGVSLYSDRGFYWKLTGRENLRYFAYLQHIFPRDAEKRINYLLKLIGLEKDADKLVEEYSTGMKSKLNFVRALLNDPPILFLDEPTIGLDPNSSRKVREVILELSREGKTIFLTTHNMEEADFLCDRIAIINRGKIIAIGSPGELKNMVERKGIIEIEAYNITKEIVEKMRNNDIIGHVSYSINDSISLKGKIRIGLNGNMSEYLPEILKILVNSGLKIVYFKPVEPSLEDVFITLTGKGFYEEEKSNK